MKVMAIAPYDGLKELISSLGEEEDFELQVEVGDLQKGVALAHEAVESGFDIIISRGGTAELIESTVPIPVVEIEVSGYDMLRVLTLVKDFSGKTAIVGFPRIAEGAATICEILDIDIASFTVHHEEEVEPKLVGLRSEGYQVIIGDAITVKKAEMLGLNGVLLTSGKESVRKAFQNAKKMHQFFSAYKRTYIVPYQIIQQDRDGAAVYTKDGHAVFANPAWQEKAGVAFAGGWNIKEACREVIQTGGFQTTLAIEGGLWTVKGEVLSESAENLAVFRLQPWKPLGQVQEPEGIAVISVAAENGALSLTNSIITSNVQMRDVLEMAERFRELEDPVWISGDPGTGKERLASFLHAGSADGSSPLIVVDCDAVSEEQWGFLLQDTGAGLFSAGQRGSIVLKDVHAIPMERQKQLYMRLIQEKPGARIISTTHQAYRGEKEHGPFYRELYYLLAKLTLHLPLLTERKEDIEGLARLFISECNAKYGKQIVGIRSEAREQLEGYPWHGNIDQLRQVVEEAVILASGSYIERETVKKVLASMPPAPLQGGIDLSGTLEEIEQRIIRRVWQEEGMNHSKTAQRLNINRTTLWRKLK